MEILRIEATDVSPGILFDPDNHTFLIDGISRPEDVRTFYYPVLEWCHTFNKEYVDTGKVSFDKKNPLKLTVRLKYFNSSSAKFLYDIFVSIGELSKKGQNVEIFWHYDEGDDDMLEAGEEMSDIAEVPFVFIENK